MQSLRKSAHIPAAYCLLLLLLLLPLVACSSHEDDNQSTSAHKTIKPKFHKLSPRMTSNIRVHGLLLWVSMGLLMPAGILSIRMSVREPRGSIPAKVFFYLHLILQMLAVLLATAGAVMSITNFENSFNNNHQRIGLALYIAIWVQALMGFLRPHKGKKERSVWYFVHWILGSLISLVGIINIYTGLEAYHKKTMRSTRLWTILFTAQVSLITFFYLYQDKREYIQQQGVILGNNIEAITPDQQNNNINNAQTNHSQKDLVPLPCAKRNALMNLFD